VPSHLGRHGDSRITTGSVDYKIGPSQVHPAQLDDSDRSLPPSAASELSRHGLILIRRRLQDDLPGESGPTARSVG